MTWYSIGRLGKEELAQRKFGPPVKTTTREVAPATPAAPAMIELTVRTGTGIGRQEGRWHWHW